jgi:hypothetical protein
MKVFHPHPALIEFVPATCGKEAHPNGTQYRVAIGMEIWGATNAQVLKVQLVDSEGSVLGRRSPSFPLHSDDFARIERAAKRLLGKAGKLAM